MRAKRGIVAGVALSAALLAGCGGSRQDAKEPRGDFPVTVVKASFPSSQRVSTPSRMSITVRNAGRKPVPDIAVTLSDPKLGSQAQAFADVDDATGLASRSRPIWILDTGPKNGDTAYDNTWALGPLPPGKTRTFTWSVVPTKTGSHTIAYRVTAGLNGKAKAVEPGGDPVQGRLSATIGNTPRQATVDDAGNVVTSP